MYLYGLHLYLSNAISIALNVGNQLMTGMKYIYGIDKNIQITMEILTAPFNWSAFGRPTTKSSLLSPVSIPPATA